MAFHTLARRAIRSGVYNDLGSGSNVDLCVITKEGAQYLRNYEYLQVCVSIKGDDGAGAVMWSGSWRGACGMVGVKKRESAYERRRTCCASWAPACGARNLGTCS